LPDQQDLSTPCRARSLERWEGVATPELDANRFAAEILMPRAKTSSLVRTEPTFAVIRKMAQMFETSLTASTYRLVELTTYRAAMVVSAAGNVVWYQSSSEFQRAVKRGPLDPRTFAHDCFAGGSGREAFERVPADAWLFDSNLRPGASIWEHSLALTTYGTVLTLLYIKDAVESASDDDDPLEEELDPSEFTLARRNWARK
jgi:hypothetical protein